MQLLEKCSLS